MSANSAPSQEATARGGGAGGGKVMGSADSSGSHDDKKAVCNSAADGNDGRQRRAMTATNGNFKRSSSDHASFACTI